MPKESNKSPFDVNTDSGTLKRRSAYGAILTFGSQALRFALQFGLQVILARLLTPGEFGLVAMVAPLLAFVYLFNDLGLSQATIQRPKITHQELSTLFWINLSLSVALCMCVALAAPLVGWFYNEQRTTWITLSLSILLIVSGLTAQQIALMNRNMRFGQLAIIDLAALAAGSIAGIITAYSGLGFWALVIMQATNSVTTLILAWLLSGWRPSWPERRTDVKPLLNFGRDIMGFNLVNFFARNLDNVLIGRAYGQTELGIYDRAYKLMTLPLLQISSPASRIAIPLLSRLHDSNDEYRRVFQHMLQMVLLVVVPGVLWAVTTAEELISLVLGPQWVEVTPIFVWLGIGALFAPIGQSTGWLFVSQNRTRQNFKWGCISSGIFVTSFAVGLPWGALGVAIAYILFGCLLQGPLLWWAATREGPVRLPDLINSIYPFFLSVPVVVVALLLCKEKIEIPVVGKLVACLLLSYLVCYVGLACTAGGRTILRSAWDVKRSLWRSRSIR